MFFRIGSVKLGDRPTIRAGAIMLFAFALCSAPPAYAQSRGVPASVTSPGFGGDPGRTNGTPASVTSLGPNGFGRHSNFRIESGFPSQPNRNLFPHHPHHPGFPIYYPYAYLPYYSVPYPIDSYADDSAQNDDEQYKGGPTIFDRRGPGTPVRSYREDYSEHREELAADTNSIPKPEPARIADQTPTVLVFKDGHQLEIANYAIVGSTLYDLRNGARHKIALADLDVAATTKQNDDRGVDFQLPASGVQN